MGDPFIVIIIIENCNYTSKKVLWFFENKDYGTKNYHDNHWPFNGNSNTYTTLVWTLNVNFHKCFDLYMLTKKVM
jgi:hypothetical protein